MATVSRLHRSMELRTVKVASLAVALITTSCGSPSGQSQPRMTLIDIPVHHPGGGMPEDIKTSWYRVYVLKTNSLALDAAINVEVRGEVSKPGSISVARGTTVLEAIKMAGGFTEFAFSRRVIINDARHHLNLSLHRQRRGILNHSRVWCGDGAGDFVLEPGAIIYVARGV